MTVGLDGRGRNVELLYKVAGDVLVIYHAHIIFDEGKIAGRNTYSHKAGQQSKAPQKFL